MSGLDNSRSRLRARLDDPDRSWSDEALDEADGLIDAGDLEAILGVLRHLDSSPPLTRLREAEIERINANADPATQAAFDRLLETDGPLPPPATLDQPPPPPTITHDTQPDPDPDASRYGLGA